MRTFFVLSAFVILVPAALPQTSNWTLRRQAEDLLKSAALAGSGQAPAAANLAATEALSQLARNGLAQDSAQPMQPLHPQPLLPPQVSPWTGPFAKMGPYDNGLNLGIRRQELVGMLPNPPKACAIPLLEVPVDGSYDQGIRIPHGMRGGSTDPKMAVPPPAPVCDNQPSPQPKLKVK